MKTFKASRAMFSRTVAEELVPNEDITLMRCESDAHKNVIDRANLTVHDYRGKQD